MTTYKTGNLADPATHLTLGSAICADVQSGETPRYHLDRLMRIVAAFADTLPQADQYVLATVLGYTALSDDVPPPAPQSSPKVIVVLANGKLRNAYSNITDVTVELIDRDAMERFRPVEAVSEMVMRATDGYPRVQDIKLVHA